MVSRHEPVPLQAPAHPAKKDPWLATAVNVTVVPEPKTAVQVGAQRMPAGLLVALPLPVPANRRDSWNEVASDGATGESEAESEAGEAWASPRAEPFRINPALKHAATESTLHRVTNRPPQNGSRAPYGWWSGRDGCHGSEEKSVHSLLAPLASTSTPPRVVRGRQIAGEAGLRRFRPLRCRTSPRSRLG